MKKFALILVVALVLSFAGCGGDRKATISAKDYDTRLKNLSSTMDVRELNEISTMVLGCKAEDFDVIIGWHQDTNIIDEKCYKKDIYLDSRKVTVTLDLNGNYVRKVDYDYETSYSEDFFGYISFNVDSADIEIAALEGAESKTITEDEMIALLSAVTENEGEVQFSTKWNYTAKNGDESRMLYGYFFTNTPNMGLVLHGASLSYFNIP